VIARSYRAMARLQFSLVLAWVLLCFSVRSAGFLKKNIIRLRGQVTCFGLNDVVLSSFRFLLCGLCLCL
jgi:hypothetical protein